jgi:ubiquinone/menaquinone biosynthesis C-methylase UbiE
MLSNEESEYYDKFYQPALTTGLLGNIQRNIHKCLDSVFEKSQYDRVIEVGAGSLEHLLASKKLSFNSYIATDIRYGSQDITNNLLNNLEHSLKKNIQLEFADAQKLRFENRSFDALVATCLLIHLKEPEKALKEWRRVIKKGGELNIYVPCEPGLLLRAGRRLAVVPKHRRLGFHDYELVCAREHVSSINILDTLIRYVFQEDDIEIRTWPIPKFRFWNLNLAFIYHITVSNNR